MTQPFAIISLLCAISGWGLFLSWFCNRSRLFVEWLFAEKAHWALLLSLLLALVCSISALVFGHKGFAPIHDKPMLLTGLILGYTHLPILAIGIVFAIISWHNSYRS